MNNMNVIDIWKLIYNNNRSTKTGSTRLSNGVEDFGKLLSRELKKTNALQMNVDKLSKKLATGELKDIHQLTIAVAKVDIALRLITEIRNKLVEAYQQISRMTL